MINYTIEEILLIIDSIKYPNDSINLLEFLMANKSSFSNLQHLSFGILIEQKINSLING